MKKSWLKKAGSMVLAVIAAGSLAACGNTGDSGQGTNAQTKAETQQQGGVPEVVNIGVQTLITPELVARYENIYEQYLGTKVNLVQLDSGADVNKAFFGKSVDIAAFGSSPAALGISNDLGFEVFWYYDVIGSAETLIATKKSGAEKVEDLKGLKVATPFASTAHYSLLHALEQANVAPSEVELLDMQPNDIYAAWKRGDIDAAYVWNPVLGELKKEDGTVITDSGKLAEQGIVTADVAAVRKEFADQYPDVVADYVKAQIYALDKFNSDKENAIKEIAEAAGISEEDAASQVEDFTYPSAEEQITDAYLGTEEKKGELAQTLKNTADFLVEQGSIEKAPDLSVFEDSVTGEFIEKALSDK